ncbi:MAG: nitrogen regulation protein NR(I) [Magnetococcales bacterium]|nr:nitrogen regulation protein NR(I) [Magnetococcales bacterium]
MNREIKTILIADDDRSIRFVLETALTNAGFQVNAFEDGRDLLAVAAQGQGDLVITDVVMPSVSGLDLLKTINTTRPGLPVIVITAQSTLRNAVQAFERGAFEYISKPFDIVKIVDLVKQALSQENKKAKPRHLSGMDSDRFGGFIGSSLAMQELFRTIGRLANSEMTVLIHGESGTGKELVARAVHAHSPRRKGPMTTINMAAIPKNLIESELFGHEKGAFTGAISRRTGHFERAKGGTLFLDEIGDMSMDAQTRLLRVIQDGTFTRVGGQDTLTTNVRIVAATHQDLPAAITEGRFREDLYYRLNVVPLYIPSLRARPEDIPLLADFFLAQVAKKTGERPKQFSVQAMEQLSAYSWPGNVRELENMVQRLMVLVSNDLILPEHLDLSMATNPSSEDLSEPLTMGVELGTEVDKVAGPELEDLVIAAVDQHFRSPDARDITNLYDLIVNRVEVALITRVLQETHGNRVKAAGILGINRNTLRKKIQDHGL